MTPEALRCNVPGRLRLCRYLMSNYHKYLIIFSLLFFPACLRLVSVNDGFA